MKAPPFPMPPRRGPPPEVIGSGNDVSAQAPTGFISETIGTFDSVSGVTSASSPIGNSGAPVQDAYTLQINTDFFSSTACAGSPNPGCRGWEQFVFFNDGNSGIAFIQYWLIQYNATCPAGGGWTQFQFTGGTDIYCFKSSAAVAVPNQPIANLAQLVLTATANASGDLVTFSTGSGVFSTSGDNAVNAPAGWRFAEFNVFGAGGNSNGGGQVTFNNGSTIVPRTRIFYGGTAPPNCSGQGFTGETNNLSFGPNPPAKTPPGPAVLFTESSAGGATSNCAAAVTVGDTHLATFNGLFYDFQASGDFVLAQVDPDFVVQTRQVSGAPTWPNASVNHAVATRIGRSRVAVCLAGAGNEFRSQLVVDGRLTELADGKAISLPDDGSVLRRGNVYLIRGASGDSVRAEVNPTWINVTVGLGRWPVQVSGLLANAKGDVNQIETRDGVALRSPFAFEDLYHRYADSWRVRPNESLLTPCGDQVERGIPTKAFYANDLDPGIIERTRAVCTAAGIKAGALFDACALDVAVIGREEAAKVFAGLPAPVAVSITQSGPSAPTFRWVSGKVVSIIAQLPQFTVATVGTTGVRFCYPTTGQDFPVTADNVHFDMLRSALLSGKTVEVGVYDFGPDPQAGAEKNCIDRVILRQ